MSEDLEDTYFNFNSLEDINGFSVVMCYHTGHEVLQSNGIHRHRDNVEIDEENVRRFREIESKYSGRTEV
jgi:hypothetical protein